MQWKLLTTHITDFNNKNPPASVIDFWLLFLLTILQSDPSHMFEGILEAPLSCVFSFDFIRRSNIWTFDCCCFYVIYLIFFSSISRLPVVRMVKTCTATKIMFYVIIMEFQTLFCTLFWNLFLFTRFCFGCKNTNKKKALQTCYDFFQANSKTRHTLYYKHLTLPIKQL